MVEVLLIDYRPLPSGPPVVAELPPRIVVVQADESQIPALAERADLLVHRRPDGSTSLLGDRAVLDDLDASAQLFLRAWRQQPVSKPNRPGDGLAWDHPGFTPPDRPPG